MDKATIVEAEAEGSIEQPRDFEASREEIRLLDALRRGDEEAFTALVRRHHASLLRLARMYVDDRAIAEEVVQETWLGFLESLERFQGRASVKTWLFRILVNVARKRRGREGRSVPFSSALRETDEPRTSSLEPDRFRGPDDRFQGHWRSYPESWEGLPEERLLSREARDLVAAAISQLSPAQREVISLRDLEDGLRKRYVTRWACRRPINESCCIERARRCGGSWNVTSMLREVDLAHPGEITCQELVELVTGYLEGDRALPERQLFEEHLSFCEGCVVYVDQMRRTLEVVGSLREDAIPAPALDELMRTFGDWRRRRAGREP
ncbi:MAG: sigma-70 family RNA polymerase sigma factor [Actinomycetota bacterium]